MIIYFYLDPDSESERVDTVPKTFEPSVIFKRNGILIYYHTIMAFHHLGSLLYLTLIENNLVEDSFSSNDSVYEEIQPTLYDPVIMLYHSDAQKGMPNVLKRLVGQMELLVVLYERFYYKHGETSMPDKKKIPPDNNGQTKLREQILATIRGSSNAYFLLEANIFGDECKFANQLVKEGLAANPNLRVLLFAGNKYPNVDDIVNLSPGAIRFTTHGELSQSLRLTFNCPLQSYVAPIVSAVDLKVNFIPCIL